MHNYIIDIYVNTMQASCEILSIIRRSIHEIEMNINSKKIIMHHYLISITTIIIIIHHHHHYALFLQPCCHRVVNFVTNLNPPVFVDDEIAVRHSTWRMSAFRPTTASTAKPAVTLQSMYATNKAYIIAIRLRKIIHSIAFKCLIASLRVCGYLHEYSVTLNHGLNDTDRKKYWSVLYCMQHRIKNK